MNNKIKQISAPVNDYDSKSAVTKSQVIRQDQIFSNPVSHNES